MSIVIQVMKTMIGQLILVTTTPLTATLQKSEEVNITGRAVPKDVLVEQRRAHQAHNVDRPVKAEAQVRLFLRQFTDVLHIVEAAPEAAMRRHRAAHRGNAAREPAHKGGEHHHKHQKEVPVPLQVIVGHHHVVQQVAVPV